MTSLKRDQADSFTAIPDFDSWERRGLLDVFYRTTASTLNLRSAADILRAGLKEARPKGAYAVFYDPCVGRKDAEKAGWKPLLPPNADYRAIRAKETAKATELAREELREQVKDFIKWLKAQGVI